MWVMNKDEREIWEWLLTKNHDDLWRMMWEMALPPEGNVHCKRGDIHYYLCKHKNIYQIYRDEENERTKMAKKGEKTK